MSCHISPGFDMAPEGGIRKRILSEGSPEPEAPPMRPDERRCLKKRLASGSASSTGPDPEPTGPLTEAWKQDWGQGKLSSKKVQEYAFKAEQQGAYGMGR